MAMRALALAATVVVLAAAPVAAAPQLRASHRPRTTGPLESAGKSCKNQTLRGDGVVYLRSEACVFVFNFKRLSEIDPLRAYGVVWLQYTLDAERGLCADRLAVALEFPDNTMVEAFAPEESIPGRRGRRAKVKLDVTAAGNALEDASVSQKLIVVPARLDGRAATTSVVVGWRGHTAEKVALVGGAEVGWSEFNPLDSIELRIDDIEVVSC